MKMFCQKCGSDLKEGILICPKCGFENNNIQKKGGKIKLALYIFGALVLISAVYFLYNSKINVATIFNGDSKKIQQFEAGFTEYRQLRIEFEKSNGLTKYKTQFPNAYSSNGNEALRVKTIKADDEKIEKLPSSLRALMYYCDTDKNNLTKCEQYKKLKNDNPSEKCSKCNEKITSLYQVASSIRKAEISNELVKFVDILRTQQTLYDSDDYVELPDAIFDKIYCVANQDDIMVRGEEPEYQGMLIHLVNREKCLKEMNEYNDKFNIINNQINDNNTAINNYMSVLNGSMNFNLPNSGL